MRYDALKNAARDVAGVDPEDYGPAEYDALREEMSDKIKECRWCDAEFVTGWSDTFCTDQCEIAHINEYHRD